MFVIRPVLRYRCLLSNKNSVSPPSAAVMADSVIGNGESARTPPITFAFFTSNSCPPGARSSTLTIPVRIIDASISAPLIDSNISSPTSSLFATHCMVPVESRNTMKRILFEPRVLFIHPFSSTSTLSCNPD